MTDIDTLLAQWTQLIDARDQIDSQLDELRAQMADLGEGRHDGSAGRISVTRTKRFDKRTAATVLADHPEVLASVTETAISGSLAKKVLPPVLYEACQVQAPTPTVRVTIS